jgi:cobalt-zinc-cadmium efflux system outer membrane protein
MTSHAPARRVGWANQKDRKMKREPLTLIPKVSHMVVRNQLLVVGALLFAGGCSMYQSAAQEVSTAVGTWHRPSYQEPLANTPQEPIDGDAAGPTRPPETTRDVTASRPPGALGAYIEEALERNPTVNAAIANVEAALERIPQVTSLPDPFLRAIARPEPIQTAAGDMYFTLGVGQMFPLPEKLKRAGLAAVAEVRMAIERLNAVRLRVIADVEHAYFAVYLADRSLELIATNRSLLEQLEGVVQAQYEGGSASQQDLLRVQTELAELIDGENRERGQRDSAAAALNRLLDRDPETPVPFTEPMLRQALDLQAEELIQLAEDHNPELARLRRQKERDEERLAHAKLGYWPDVTLGVEWTYVDPRPAFKPPINPQTGQRPPYNRKSEAGDDNWAISVQFNVPLWFDRVEAAKREARLRMMETEQEIRASRNMIAFRVYDAWTRVHTEQDSLRVVQSTLIPQARQTYEVALTSYQAGGADFLTVIDNWRRRLDFELMAHRYTVALQNALSDLQQEVGLQLIESQQSSTPATDKESS